MDTSLCFTVNLIIFYRRAVRETIYNDMIGFGLIGHNHIPASFFTLTKLFLLGIILYIYTSYIRERHGKNFRDRIIRIPEGRSVRSAAVRPLYLYDTATDHDRKILVTFLWLLSSSQLDCTHARKQARDHACLEKKEM